MTDLAPRAEEGAARTSAAASLVAARVAGGIAEIALAHPPLNLVNKDLLRALNRALAEIAARPDVRCVILHGGDARAFCAGSDIGEFAQLRSDASEHKILFGDMVLREARSRIHGPMTRRSGP